MKKWVFYLQTFWIVLIGGFMWSLARIIIDSYWLSIPLFLIMWIVSAWIGITILSLFNPTIRKSSMLGMKYEDYEYLQMRENEFYIDLEDAGYNVLHDNPDIEFDDWVDTLMRQYPTEVTDAIGTNPVKVYASLKDLWKRIKASQGVDFVPNDNKKSPKQFKSLLRQNMKRRGQLF